MDILEKKEIETEGTFLVYSNVQSPSNVRTVKNLKNNFTW